MKQETFEVNTILPETTLSENPAKLTTDEIAIRGYDLVKQNPTVSKEFIGPNDASDCDRGLLTSQSRNLAMIAVMNAPLLDQYKKKAITDVKVSMASGTLRLGKEFYESKAFTADQQAEQFVMSNMMNAYKPYDAVSIAIITENEAIRTAQHGEAGEIARLTKQLQEKTVQLEKQGRRILIVRSKLVERGASDEFMREFDYDTKLMSEPDVEAYEVAKKLTPLREAAPLVNTEEVRILHSFKDIVATLTKESLRLVGINPPFSTAATSVKQHETI